MNLEKVRVYNGGFDYCVLGFLFTEGYVNNWWKLLKLNHLMKYTHVALI